MEQISIRTKTHRFSANFEPVRQIGHYRLGWATVETAERSFRFPAMIAMSGTSWTVRDWDGPWSAIDLNDRFELKELLATGQGAFYFHATGKGVSGGPGQAIYGFVKRPT